MKNKLKVVWICHFSNEEVRKRLPLSKMKLLSFIRTALGKEKKKYYTDFAPWVTNLIKEFEKFNEVELHVISPHQGMTRLNFEFVLNGIFYHFFKPDLPLIHLRPKKHFKNIKFLYLGNRRLVKKLLNRIKPDIVNLIGTENPYYSITTLDINNIPIYVSTQTVYTNPERKKHDENYHQLNWDVELLIHKKEKYYGCMGRMHRDLILHNNPEAIIFKMFFPFEKPNKVLEMPKKFDFVFFARVVAKKKGVEDIINALNIVKMRKSDVKLNIVGHCSQEYKEFLNGKIKKLNLERNIIFNDYFPLHSDMHQHITQSHYAVLPVKLDILPGAVIEAILLELPLVTYKTTGTPFLNKDKESVLLADIGDIEMLAKQMLRVLNSPDLAQKLKQNAKEFVERELDNTTSANRLLNNYRAVINHYYNNTPIPEEQLFNINEFPLY